MPDITGDDRRSTPYDAFTPGDTSHIPCGYRPPVGSASSLDVPPDGRAPGVNWPAARRRLRDLADRAAGALIPAALVLLGVALAVFYAVLGAKGGAR